MNFKKCNRCGCFYTTDSNVCCNCQTKDNLEIEKLTNYIEKNGNNYSLEELSVSTGISVKNLNRFINDNGISISL